MGNETLKKLAQDYAIGEIDRYNYRQQRTRLIDEITEYNNTNNSIPDSVPANINSSLPSSDNPEFAPLFSNIKVIAIAIAVIAMVITIILLTSRDETGETQANTTSELTVPNAETLVRTFINYDDWTSERVSYFVAGWQSLTESQKQEAHQATWFQTLIENMKTRLLEQQQLAKSGSQEAQQKEQSILSLAILLGIRL